MCRGDSGGSGVEARQYRLGFLPASQLVKEHHLWRKTAHRLLNSLRLRTTAQYIA